MISQSFEGEVRSLALVRLSKIHETTNAFIVLRNFVIFSQMTNNSVNLLEFFAAKVAFEIHVCVFNAYV